MANPRILSSAELKYWLEKLILKNTNFNELSYQFNQQLLSKSIDYRLVFSVSENNTMRFNNILDSFLNDGCQQEVWEGSKFYLQNLQKKDFEFFKNFLTTDIHATNGVNFVKFSYNFKKTPLLQTIFFIQTIKDVVEIIGNFWGFNEIGQEVCCIKYPVGSIVSLINESGDFFVESIEYVRKGTKEFKNLEFYHGLKDELLLYHLLKMESKIDSQVLEFSNSIITSSDYIKPNRSHRLNELLK